MTFYVVAAILKMLSSYLIIAILANKDSTTNFVNFLWWTSVLPYFSLLDLGYFSVWKNRIAKNRFHRKLLSIWTIIIPMILASGIGVGIFYWISIFKRGADFSMTSGLMLALSCALVPGNLIADNILQGHGRHHISRFLDIVGSVTSVFFVWYSVQLRMSVEFIIFISLMPSAFVKLIACFKFVEMRRPRGVELNWHQFVLTKGFNFSPAQLMASAYSSMPVVMALFLSFEAVRGDLLLLNKIGVSLVAVTSSVMPYLWVKIGGYKNLLEKKKYIGMLRVNTRIFSSLISLGYCFGYFLFIPILFKINHTAPVVAIFSFSIYVFCMININLASTEMNALSSFGLQTKAFFLITCVAYLVFVIFKVANFELWAPYIGVAVSSALGYFLFSRFRNFSNM